MIIDIHSHLGNILYPNGGDLIWKKGVKMEKIHDPQGDNEKLLMRTFGLGKYFYKLLEKQTTRGQRARNAIATLENLQNSLNEAQIDYTVCLPIAPYVTFEDIARASKKENRIIPFTSVDFTSVHDVGAKLAKDVSEGAMGLKLHPIIQRVPLTDNRTIEAVQQFARHEKPVLIHAGKAHYYLADESEKHVPEYGNIEYAEKLVRSFPNVNFILGHAGLFWQDQVRKKLGDCKNVWVDTSFQSPGIIRKLIRTFGPEKVMYASDWPWGFRMPHIKTVKVACRGDMSLERMIYYENAAGLLGIKA
ncbi:MAG: amidohydrolase family protein [Desulfobacterales bacterium]|nr:amidohydrolase family protein [Desulfobacterales bacterium]